MEKPIVQWRFCGYDGHVISQVNLMVQVEPIDFGILIAFILPGSVAVYGLRYVSPRISALWSILESGQVVIGPLILLALATLAVGLIVSSLRVVLLEPIFHVTGVRQENIDYQKLANADQREFFKEMIKNVYRYEQFYGNTLLALLFCSFLRYFVGRVSICQTRMDQMVSVAIIGSLITLFVAGRKSLRDVYRSISELKLLGKGD
jgi:hypothetical protein